MHEKEEDDASGNKGEGGEDSSAASSFVFGQNIKDRAKVFTILHL